MRRQGKGESKQSEIRRKLQQSGISKAEQFEEIISNLMVQRERLEGDLRMLRQKVVMLHQKQALRQRQGKVRQVKPKTMTVNYRQELQRKYDELKMWQKRSVKAMKNSAVDVQYRTYLDKLFSVEQEIQTELRRYADQRITWRRLRKAVRLLGREQARGAGLQEGVQRENRLLKKRVGSLRKIVDRQLVKEIDLQNNLIDMRQKERLVVERERAYRREQSRLGGQRHQTEVVNEMSQSSLSQDEEDEIISIDIVPGQVLTRDEVYQIEGRMNRIQGRWRDEMRDVERRVKKNYPNEALNVLRDGSKLSFGKELELTLDRCRNNLNIFAQLNKHKVQLLLSQIQKNGLDTERSADIDYIPSGLVKGFDRTQHQGSPFSTNKSIKRMAVTLSPQFGHRRESQSKQKQITEKYVQTQVSEYNDPFPLRRDFVGLLQQLRSDDRGLLGRGCNSSIKTLRVYYTDRGIASVQAIYNLNVQQRILQGKLSLPTVFVQSYCKVHVIDTNFQDFIRYFKLRYNKEQGRIMSLKVVSNRNVKNGFGQGRGKIDEVDSGEQVQKEYVFDIGRDQYPVSIFCSHIQRGPYWYLCGFGVEVDDL